MLETKRLKLIPISNQDTDFFKSFYSNHKCTKYIPIPSVSIEILINNRINHWEKYSIGTYSVRLSNNEIIGYCGVEYIENSLDPDIRFGFIQSVSSNGFAKESAKLSLLSQPGFLPSLNPRRHRNSQGGFCPSSPSFRASSPSSSAAADAFRAFVSPFAA